MSACVNSDKCKVAACTACWRRWFLEQPTCKCMTCDTSYDRKTVARMGGKTWQDKELKQHKQRLLQEQHKARLPVLQESIRKRLVSNAVNQKIREIHNERIRLRLREVQLTGRAEALSGRFGGLAELDAEAVDAIVQVKILSNNYDHGSHNVST